MVFVCVYERQQNVYVHVNTYRYTCACSRVFECMRRREGEGRQPKGLSDYNLPTFHSGP